MALSFNDVLGNDFLHGLNALFEPSKLSQEYQTRLRFMDEALKHLADAEMRSLIKECASALRRFHLANDYTLRLVNANDVPQLKWLFLNHPLHRGEKSQQFYYLQAIAPINQLDKDKQQSIAAMLSDRCAALGRQGQALMTVFAQLERQRLSLNFKAKTISNTINNIKRQYDCRNLIFKGGSHD